MIVQNRKATNTETEEDDDDEDDEMPEEIGTPKKYDTSERDGIYADQSGRGCRTNTDKRRYTW